MMFRMSGKVWIKQMIVSAFILPAVVCGTAFFINFIAIYYHASRAIPFGTMVAVTCICLFVILPLTLVGTVLGRNLAGTPDYPCRTVFSTLIGRAPTRLGSHWSRASILCHREPARRLLGALECKVFTHKWGLFCLLLAGSLWHRIAGEATL